MPTCLCSAVNPSKFYRFFRGKISKPFLPDWPWYFKQGPREEQTSPRSQSSVSFCICCPSKAQPHNARREAKMTGAVGTLRSGPSLLSISNSRLPQITSGASNAFHFMSLLEQILFWKLS